MVEQMTDYDASNDEEMDGFHFDDEWDGDLNDEDEIDPQKDTFFTQTYDDDEPDHAKK
jgi:hypothetical protein